MIGRVTSNKSEKTATVLVERTKRHPLYRKDYVSTKKYLVDDSLGVKVGDIVEFVKCAPISKRKHWKITKVVGADIVALGEKAMKELAAEAIAEVLPEETEEVSEEPGKTQKVRKSVSPESQSSSDTLKDRKTDTPSPSESSGKKGAK